MNLALPTTLALISAILGSAASADVRVENSVLGQYSVPGYVAKVESAAGEVSASSSLSISGAYSYASADLAGGFLKAVGAAPLPVNQGELEKYVVVNSTVDIWDTLLFAGNTPFSGAISVLFLGDLSTPPRGDLLGSPRAWGQVSGEVLGGSGTWTSEEVSATTDCAEATASPTCIQGTSVRTQLLLPFEVTEFGRSISLHLQLRTQSYLGGQAEFGQSAYFRIEGMPADVTFSSSSGAFLANPVALPVPEPSVYAMFAAGLVAVALLARRRGALGASPIPLLWC